MDCRSSWFLPDCSEMLAADSPAASTPDNAAPQDYAPQLPRARYGRNWRGVFDSATAAELAATRDSGAALDVLDLSAANGVDRADGPSLLVPVLLVGFLFAVSR